MVSSLPSHQDGVCVLAGQEVKHETRVLLLSVVLTGVSASF